MDAVEFIKEYRRMCKKYAYMEACGEDCSSDCPLKDCYCDVRYKNTDIESTVSKVEQWSKEHPQKTMMQDFFEKFPNAPKNEKRGGVPSFICPKHLGYTNIKEDCTELFDGDCAKCWSRPMED